MSLKLDWCDYKSAAWACRNWHYSKSVPAGKAVKIGVWENGTFKGVIFYSRGANKSIGSPYGLKQTQICELTRVALKEHDAPVTKMIAISIKMLKKYCPELKLIVSYADVDQGHEGGIYKAGNWIYEGLYNKDTLGAFIIHGKKTHPKTVHSKWGKGSQSINWIRKNVDPNAKKYITKGKHKFIYPLDKQWYDNYMRQQSKSKTANSQLAEDGAVPILTHQNLSDDGVMNSA